MRSCLQKSKPHSQKTGRPGFGISAPEPGGSRSPNLIPHPQAPQHPYSDGFSRLRAPMEMSCASAASSWGDFLRTKCDVCSGALAKPRQGAQARLSTWCVSAYARAPPSSPSTAHLWGVPP